MSDGITDMMNEQERLISIALTSPALTWQNPKKGKAEYPARFLGRVPRKVKMAKTVISDLPFASKSDTKAVMDEEYYVWVNSYGAVSAILPNGEQLGLMPSEFDVIDWH